MTAIDLKFMANSSEGPGSRCFDLVAAKVVYERTGTFEGVVDGELHYGCRHKDVGTQTSGAANMRRPWVPASLPPA